MIQSLEKRIRMTAHYLLTTCSLHTLLEIFYRYRWRWSGFDSMRNELQACTNRLMNIQKHEWIGAHLTDFYD
jgi:hypothetical protein